MAKKKKKAKKKRAYAKKGTKGHVKRGCGKGRWARGGRAYWTCKPGTKKHAYQRAKANKAKKKKKARR